MKQRIQRTLALLLAAATLCIAAFVPTAVAESIYAYVSDSSGLNAYSDADLSNRIGTLDAYAVVEVVGLSGSTAAIYANGVGCFVRVSGLTPLQTEENERVTTEKTKVYASPSTSSASINVPKDMTLYEVRRNGDWAEIANGAYVAYIPTRYITTKTITVPAPTSSVNEVSIPATVTGANARAYASADTSSASVSVPQGTKVTVLLMNGSWAYVERGSVRAFFRISDLTADAYLEVVPTATPKPTAAPSLDDAIPATVTGSNAKIYLSPSKGSNSVSIPQGTKVNVLAINGDWVYLEVNGVYAYCPLSDVTADAYLNQMPAPTATPAPTQAPETNTVIPATVTASNAKVYASPSTSARSMSVPAGLKVNVLMISGDWAYVERSGAYAYCKVAILTPDSQLPAVTPEPTIEIDPSESIRGVVIADSVRVYSLPSTSGRYLGTMERGVEVDVFKISGGWAYVRRDGAFGFCDVSALAPVEAAVTPKPTSAPANSVPAIVTAPFLRVYKAHSMSSQRLGMIDQGTVVNVVDIYESWAQIELYGNYGWCDISGLEPTTQTPEPLEPDEMDNPIPAVVSAKAVAVYASYSTSSTYYGTLSRGETVNVYAICRDWAKIEKNGNYGWCAWSGLTPVSNTPTEDPMKDFYQEVFDATVVNSGARFYASASTDSANVAIPIGTTVTVGAYNATWAYVQVNGVVGFISTGNLSRNNYAPMRIGATGSDVRQLETALLTLGYLDTNPGTKYSDYTASAVKAFQKRCGISATGEADLTTLRVLYGGSALKSDVLSSSYSQGSSGDNVSRIQLRLYALGYLSKASSVDGDFGATTSKAIRLFQSANGFDPTGELTGDNGQLALQRLYSTKAKSLPSDRSPADISNVPNPSAGDQQNNSTKISSALASTTTSPGSTNASKLEYVIYIGQNQLGKPYIYGTSGTSSFDCTGFTCYCFKQIGIKLKRSAVDQGYDNTYPKITSISDLRRGDLVFFNTISDSDLSDHAGIYLGAGYFIHASSGQHKVVVSTLASGYYNRVFSWGRRVLD